MLSAPHHHRRTALKLLAAGTLTLPRTFLAATTTQATPTAQATQPAPAAPASPTDLKTTIQSGFKLLDDRYWSAELAIWLDKPGNDLRAWYEGRLNPPWWSCANAVETLADFMATSGSRDWLPRLAEMHRRHHSNPDHTADIIPALKQRGQWSPRDEARRAEKPRPRHSTKPGFKKFNNEYLDDSGWWGLAWLKMHKLTKVPAYLETARAIQKHMDAHRLPDGGIIWNLENVPPVTNAISNSLFLTLSARLHTATGEQAFLDAALKTHRWFIDQKLHDGIGIVDGPGHQGDYWSYNQGMWILSLLALGEATKDPQYLQQAAAFTRSLLDKAGFVKNGILTEKLSQTGWDTALFKAAFARGLGALHASLTLAKTEPALAADIARLLENSATSLLQNSRGPTGEYGLQWQPDAKDQEWNFNTQLAALTELTATLAISAATPSSPQPKN